MAEVHISPVRTYATILGALLVLTGVTVWVAFYDLGPLNDVVALGIAVIKATLVVLFFMHVKYAGRLVKLTVVGGFFWLLILFGLTVIDYVTRGDIVLDPPPVINPIAFETEGGA
ncbi:MAG TPA: cytochrome C oxidase subunit IV family protein [Thermoanaerobaculia bacterium]|nr:cytochrome C oxidase subunit IV family protein [Thermoanaerobaculia bacterium]